MTSLTRLFEWARPYRGRFAAGLVCVVISTALASVMPTLIRRAIDAMAVGAPVRDVLGVGATMAGLTLHTDSSQA